jgi:DNA-binding LacI/PurR family transcriptional regulator
MPLAPDGFDGPADAARQAAAQFHSSRQRLVGYREALETAGVDWTSVRVQEGGMPHGRDAGRRAAAALLDRADRPTALLAMSDELAIGALEIAEERGIDVPGRLSVVGFDDAPAAAQTRPALTTVWQPHREKGEAAALLLLDGDGAAADRMLPTRLVVRASTAPAERGGA